MNKLTSAILLLLIIIPMHSLFSQNSKNDDNKSINWMSFEEAAAQAKKKPKMVFVDVYTDWCGWCKRMDASTFADSIIVHWMQKYFYAVKLNAECKDTIMYNDEVYINPNPNTSRSTHKLAITLLQGQLAYPSYVILNDKMVLQTKVMGYKEVADLESILAFYAQGAYKKMTFEKFKETFTSGVVK